MKKRILWITETAAMLALLEKHGEVQHMETEYATFRGCRNLRDRALSVKEYLFLLEK